MRADSKRRDKNYQPKYEVNVSEVSFEIQKIKFDAAGKPLLVDGKPQKRLGQMVLTYNTLDRDRDRRTNDVELKLPIISAWVSPSDGEVVKAHMTVFQPYVNDIGANYLEAAMFYRAVLRAGQATVNREAMTMIASSQLIFRYGRPHNHPFEVTESTDGDYVRRRFFDSKAFAIAAILQRIKDKQMKNIGGVSVASFSEVADDLLIQFGFTKIPDVMNRGLPMWSGDADIFREAEHELRYSASKSKLTDQLEVFLGGLQKALVS